MTDLLTTVEASRLAGVGPTAIKRWADDGRLHCVKTAGGHRRFRRAELEALLRADARSVTGPDQWDDWFDALLDQEGQFRVEARLLIERAEAGSWAGVAARVGALLTEIGERWVRGSLTIAEEHLMSERLRRAVGRLAEALPVPSDAPVCLLAAAEGDPHTGGLCLGELTLRECGWRALWAGAPMPASELASTITRWRPRLVALSASSLSKPAMLAKEAERVATACRRAGAVLVLGGEGRWPVVRDARRLDSFPAFATLLHEVRLGPPARR